MADGSQAGSWKSGRRTPEELERDFGDLHPLYDAHEARVAADRCYFCYDAPCITACPTAIDIPLFIRQIQAGQPGSAAKTIWDQNVLGGMCARVCPTETLCEEACVREAAEGRPVEIGRLQRYATDTLMTQGVHPYERAASTGRRVAVVGAGPAGLSCAHRVAMRGHDVVIFEARPKPGGLNEYGIAAYKTPDGFAQAEVDWLLRIGGIEIREEHRLGSDISLDTLRGEFDAVFLGMGLGGTRAWKGPGDDKAGQGEAVHFIADLRQSSDLGALPVGGDVVVVGGGMTAVDAAVQSKLLGAGTVTILYRRAQDRMPASRWEQDLATSKGVRILDRAVLREIVGNGAVAELIVDRVGDDMQPTGEVLRLACDQLLRAIGQVADGLPDGLETDGGKIAADARGRTSLPGVWAGGDCTPAGDDLTVTAVAQGRDAAEDIHAVLMAAAPARTGALVAEPLRGIDAPPHGETPHPGTHG
ncbi:glutamate synthase (NADPH/NADH) small chain [Hasllibacter halocynthiae]|uniref:Glutamate synthase (NADPH/NADH) small chain n=1 Tax=Hasllibacter halocynthiae TaxID=595589 RepID=A0A2T0X939_9RHOB|nr:NAD(P)-dependent oxidoreductase [Hasllibacter halocynthiae]PRY95439.1 glutamate synthase (NADPH/NADH) small chain [Hasllibacter halocynthiae]